MVGKSLSFTVRVYLNLQLSFFTQFREKLFLYANNKGTDQPAAQFYQLSLESMIAKLNTCKKIKNKIPVRHACADPDNFNGGGGGGGGRIASRGRFVPVFLLGNKWQLMIFMGRSGHSVSCLRPYQIFKQFEFTFYHYFFAGPGQFTKRLLIISADAKGKDSMILFKIKETAHINSGHVLF